MFVLKGCPRCHGDLYENGEDELVCIQCGYEPGILAHRPSSDIAVRWSRPPKTVTVLANVQETAKGHHRAGRGATKSRRISGAIRSRYA